MGGKDKLQEDDEEEIDRKKKLSHNFPTDHLCLKRL